MRFLTLSLVISSVILAGCDLFEPQVFNTDATPESEPPPLISGQFSNEKGELSFDLADLPRLDMHFDAVSQGELISSILSHTGYLKLHHKVDRGVEYQTIDVSLADVESVWTYVRSGDNEVLTSNIEGETREYRSLEIQGDPASIHYFELCDEDGCTYEVSFDYEPEGAIGYPSEPTATLPDGTITQMTHAGFVVKTRSGSEPTSPSRLTLSNSTGREITGLVID